MHIDRKKLLKWSSRHASSSHRGRSSSSHSPSHWGATSSTWPPSTAPSARLHGWSLWPHAFYFVRVSKKIAIRTFEEGEVLFLWIVWACQIWSNSQPTYITGIRKCTVIRSMVHMTYPHYQRYCCWVLPSYPTINAVKCSLSSNNSRDPGLLEKKHVCTCTQ